MTLVPIKPHLWAMTLKGLIWINGWVVLWHLPDGVIYYSIPANANQILAIDPIGEFLATTKAIMQEHPEEFGSLFQPIQADEDSVKSSSFTNFDLAVVKFWQPVNDWLLERIQSLPIYDCGILQTEPRASNSSFASTRCFLDLSWVNSCLSGLEGNAPKKKKW